MDEPTIITQLENHLRGLDHLIAFWNEQHDEHYAFYQQDFAEGKSGGYHRGRARTFAQAALELTAPANQLRDLLFKMKTPAE